MGSIKGKGRTGGQTKKGKRKTGDCYPRRGHGVQDNTIENNTNRKEGKRKER